MLTEYWVCKEHNEKITNICLEKHECSDRKLCPQCLDESHSGLLNQMTPRVQQFQMQVMQKLNDYKDEQQPPILKILKTYQDKINQLFQSLQTQVQEVFKYIEISDNDLNELKNKLLTHSAEFSASELNQMIAILSDNLIEKIQQKKRSHIWTILHKNDDIGGGKFDEKGLKKGKWTDLNENFWNYCQETYLGEYRDGLRIGQWIAFEKNDSMYQSSESCGGGKLDEKGLKKGKWNSLDLKTKKTQSLKNYDYFRIRMARRNVRS